MDDSQYTSVPKWGFMRIHECDKCNPPPDKPVRGQPIEDLPYDRMAFIPQDFWPVLKRKQPIAEIA